MIKKTAYVLLVSCITILGIIFLSARSEESHIVDASSDFTPITDKIKKTDAAIQQAIDKAAKLGGGDVYIPAGKYLISHTIVIKPTVRLQLSSAAMLVPAQDVNIVELKANSALQGGILYAYGYENFTKSAIYLDGKEKFSGTLKTAVIDNVKLVGRNGSGNGIYLYAAKSKDNVSWVQVHDLNITGFSKAIHLKTEQVEEPDKVWVNGNNFSQILISNPEYGIYIDGHSYLPYEISGNNFTNVQIQTTQETTQAIYIKGTKNYIQAMIWDNHLGAEAIHLDEDSLRNLIYSNISPKDEAMIDLGKNNLVVSADWVDPSD